jgi:selenocysteine lyase/cysteine desulfurase
MINLDRAAAGSPYPQIELEIYRALRQVRPNEYQSEVGAGIDADNEFIASQFGFLGSEISWFASASAAVEWLAEHANKILYCSNAEHLCSRRLAGVELPMQSGSFSGNHIQKDALVVVSLKNNEFGFAPSNADVDFLNARPTSMWVAVDATGASPADFLSPLVQSADFVFASPAKWGALPGCGFLLARAGKIVADGDRWTGWGKGTPSLVNIFTSAGSLRWLSSERGQQALSLDSAKHQLLECTATDLGWQKNGSGLGVSNWATDLPGEILVGALADAGVLASRGAACSSSSTRRSDVAAALLGEDVAGRTIRISWDASTRIEDFEAAMKIVTDVYRRCSNLLKANNGEDNE